MIEWHTCFARPLFIDTRAAAESLAPAAVLYIDGGNMNYAYMVKCADGTLYTGWTNCLEKRIKAHNEGKSGAKYTRAKKPVELVYFEGFATKEQAMSREWGIKQLSRREKLGLLEL